MGSYSTSARCALILIMVADVRLPYARHLAVFTPGNPVATTPATPTVGGRIDGERDGLSAAPLADSSYASSSLPASNVTYMPVPMGPQPTAHNITYQSSQSLSSPNVESPHQYSFGPSDMTSATSASPGTVSQDFTRTFDPFVPPVPLPGAFPATDEVIPSSYPAQLPSAPLLDHLLDLFFEKVPFGDRLVHRPSFMASLRQSPASSSYPSASLLHTMCAIASIYSPVIAPQVRRDSPNRSWFEYFTHADEIKLESGQAEGQGRQGTFGVEQATIGRVLALFDLRTGKRVLDTIRSMICLIWYYVSAPRSILGNFIFLAHDRCSCNEPMNYQHVLRFHSMQLDCELNSR